MYPRQVGVLQVDEEPTSLAKVAVSCVLDHLSRGITSVSEARLVGRQFEDEAVFVHNPLLPHVLRCTKYRRYGHRIETLQHKTFFPIWTCNLKFGFED